MGDDRIVQMWWLKGKAPQFVQSEQNVLGDCSSGIKRGGTRGGPWVLAGAKLWEVQLPEKGRAGGEQAGQTPLLATGGDTTNPEEVTESSRWRGRKGQAREVWGQGRINTKR